MNDNKSSEQARINYIIERINETKAHPASGHIHSVGVQEKDDCAVIPISSTEDLIVGSDFIRGPSFYLFEKQIMNWFDLGYYLVGANVSDLAAMGASPTGFFSIIRYPMSLKQNDFNSIVDGITSACSEFEMPLLGGDTGGYSEIVLSGTAIGICKKNKALRRDAGQRGDHLFLTGKIGVAASAMAYFTKIRNSNYSYNQESEIYLADSWKKLKPALKQGQELTKRNLSNCAIDTSDGLKASLMQLATSSRLGVIIYEDKLPIDDFVFKVAKDMSVNPITLALGDSVDFRLLFSTQKDKISELSSLFFEKKWELYHIGEFTAPQKIPKAQILTANGLKNIPGIEWDQSETPTIDRLIKERKGGASTFDP